uniref:ADP-ribosyl cyclase/cyclic ADP-ribose hydrolase n=2 Tax=Quercus lobata TaxID=97700 RepID=A0A7N2LLC4_QUELO
MGKTTLARVVYEMVSNQFEACSFIGNIREFSEKYGLHQLQEKLLNELLVHKDIKVKDVDNGAHMIKTRLCHKKILLVLDDVHDLDQLNKLVGEHDWFGLGSRVIITTRDAHLLKHKVDGTYEVEGLDYDEAFQLFNLKAFKQEHPNEDFLELSQAYVHYANGLPLAIDILGSFLLGRSKDEWKSELDRLKEFPERKILDTLKISFNGLAETEKEIFLYIACFFNHTNQDTIIEILDYLELYPKIGLSVLKDKSLVKWQDNHLWMHDLLQEMGRNIVHQESPNDPGERSRLWLCKDINNVLTKNTGTKKIQGIVLQPCGSCSKWANWNSESFSKMPCLKLLKIDGVHLMHDLKHLPESLRFLDWSEYPLKSLPSNFPSNELVKLCLNSSYTEQLWKGKKSFNKLKYIQVNWSKKLVETPDFTEVPVLEKLDLEGCINLRKIHPSMSVLKELTLLNLRGCINLRRLPNKFEMKSLEILILSGCLKVKRIPEFGENMDRVSELYLDDTTITKLPISIGNLTSLASLSIRDCKNLMSFPSTMLNIRSLKCLDFSGCPKLCKLLENLETVESDTSGTTIRLMPSSNFLFQTLKKLVVKGFKPRSPNPMDLFWTSLSGLTSLTKLKLENCNLREISNDIGRLFSLKEIYLCGNSFVCLPESIGQLSNLTWMELDNCTKLRSLPKLPLNIDYIRGFGCTSLETVPDLLKPNSSCEPRLYLSGCSKLAHNRIDIFLARIKKHLQGLAHDDRYDTLHLEMRYDIIIPGNEIPEWFRHQNIGAEVNIEEPSHLCNEWMGIAVCAVFCSQHSPRKFSCPFCSRYPQRKFSCPFYSEHSQREFGGPVICSLTANGRHISCVLGYNHIDVLSDHIWLLYLLPQFFRKEDIKLLWECDENGFSHIGVRFGTNGLEIKKCGMHMVYKKDIEDLNQTMAQSSNTSIIPYKGSAVEVEGNKAKRIHGDYDGAGAGPSGEGSSNDIPHPKRIKTLTEFMDLGNSDCEEPSEYKECGEELSDWEESSESEPEG